MDVAQSVEWYEPQRPGLGAAFLDELQAGFERIAEHPLLYQEVQDGVRRAMLHRSPYAVYLLVDAQAAHILAVLHAHCDPAAWSRRGG